MSALSRRPRGSKCMLQHVGCRLAASVVSCVLRRSLGMFSGKVNPVTGRMEWVLQDRDVTSEESDLSPELARSQYGDMLHDSIRNRLYCQALEKAVSDMRSKGREPHVLDIGTGTGLLAMMAARAGASKVTAVEVMRPMVRIAREVIAANGFSDVITVIPKRSTEMTEADMGGCRANVLVTEVFDTELIGEGALVTYSHAHKHLLEPDSVVIPDSATVFVQLLNSSFLWNSHKLDTQKVPGSLKVPLSWQRCPGAPSLWDLHAEELEVPSQMRPLSVPTVVAKFPLSDPSLSPDHPSPPVLVPVSHSSLCHGILMWWSVDMSGTDLSMDPWNYAQWRDHWLQAVQLLPEPLPLVKGEELTVSCRHDDYSLWFDISKQTILDAPPPPSPERPLCTCGAHTAWSRSRISMHNDSGRSRLYLQTMAEVLAGKSTVLCVSDGSLLPLLLAKADLPSLRTIYAVESNPHSARVFRELLQANPLPPNKTIQILSKPCSQLTPADLSTGQAEETRLIEAVVGEPYFSTSLLPWHNLHFWYAYHSLRGVQSESCVMLPCRAMLMAVAVRFEHLYSLRAPVGKVEGFDLSAFDTRVGKVSAKEEWVEPEPHPLWEYPSYARSEARHLMTFDLSSSIPHTIMKSTGTMNLINESEKPGGEEGCPCNAVVLWMDYQLSDNRVSTTGLVKVPDSSTERLQWSPSFKQAVHFLPPDLVCSGAHVCGLNYTVELDTASGELRFSFTPVSNESLTLD